MFWKILALSVSALHIVTLVITISIARLETSSRALVLTLAAPFITAIATLFLIALLLLIIALLSYHIPRRSIAYLSSRMKFSKRFVKPPG